MKITPLALSLLTTLPTHILSNQCINYGFTIEFDGACTPSTVIAAYADQVYDTTGASSATECTGSSAEDDLLLKLGGQSIQDLCDMVYNTQDQVPFTKAADRGTDLSFEKLFYNGLTDWQDEVETLYEDPDGGRTSILRQDAEAVKSFFEGTAQGRRVDWPGHTLPQFSSAVLDANDLATCTTNAAMCCWSKDRQANDGNGNCAAPYDENCVNKDPADNTNLCFVDAARGNQSTGFDSTDGFFGYPEDGNNGEGDIHCHGLAWSNDANDHTARYKANNLFFVSMYDHMYQRGYVKNIPGAPMCGCVEQMPTVSRSDCTQVDLTESVKIMYDGTTFTARLERVHVDFNACRGINNQNNNLWAYMARLYYQGDITPAQFGEAGRIITNTDCEQASRYHLNEVGYTRGYDHDISMWSKVAGRDDLYDGHPWGKSVFDAAFFEHTLTKPSSLELATFPQGETPIIHRICPQCTDTHKHVYYRRLTPAPEGLDILKSILYHRSGAGQEGNRWNVDFTLHSTYDDAVDGTNPWSCPNDAFNYHVPFVGNCSPSGRQVNDQYSIWNWFPGPQPDVAYYINKPEDAGVKALDLSSNERFSALHTDVDLGNVGIEGRTFEGTNGELHITASGRDIWGQADMGHYLSELRTGDVDVSVHITSFNNIVSHVAKAGIMIRSDNDDDATNVFALLSGSAGLLLQYRLSKGMSSGHQPWYKTNPVQTSAWIRLLKKMDTIEFYIRETEAEEWTLHQTLDGIRFPDDTFRVGLAVTSHHDQHVSEATFEDYTIADYNFPTSAPSISIAPTPWNADVNIGGAYEGRKEPSGDRDRYLGYGNGIWGTSDSFYFNNVQKDAASAFDVITYVDQFHTGYGLAKGGIMIRDSNDDDAAHAFLGMSGYYVGATFISRPSTGAVTQHHQTDYVPHHKAWLRLSKAAGSGVITAYKKINEADDWEEIGSTEITLTGHAIQIGHAVTSAAGSGYVWLYTKNFEIVENPGARKLRGA